MSTKNATDVSSTPSLFSIDSLLARDSSLNNRIENPVSVSSLVSNPNLSRLSFEKFLPSFHNISRFPDTVSSSFNSSKFMFFVAFVLH